MRKTIPAIVTPEVLEWARNLDGITVSEAAKRIHVKEEKIIDWENGASQPSLRQMKELAKFYRVPYVFFYLPDIPKSKKRIKKVDYRTKGNYGEPIVESRELRWLLRDIEDRRDTIISLYAEEGDKPKPFPLNMKSTETEQKVAESIRGLLKLDWEKQKRFRKPEKLLAFCISQLEAFDVLVFQAAKVDPLEMRGLSLSYDVFPIVVLNRKDEYSARLFSLIHELVHITTKNSAICNDISVNHKANNSVEMYCNNVAGLVLVPEDLIKTHPITKQIREFGFTDDAVRTLARDFAVSREVIIHRLWEINVITKPFYFETLQRYSEEYMRSVNKRKGGFLAPAIDRGTQVGKLYTRTVLSAYHRETITATSASSYLLNLGVQHFERLERWCF